MAVFSRQQATAAKLIKKNGRQAVLRHFIGATDPTKPWVQLPDTFVDLDVTIVVFPYTADSKHTAEWAKKDGDIMTGLSQALMTSKTVRPVLNDLMIFGGKTYSILNIDELAPNGEPILYTIALKE